LRLKRNICKYKKYININKVKVKVKIKIKTKIKIKVKVMDERKRRFYWKANRSFSALSFVKDDRGIPEYLNPESLRFRDFASLSLNLNLNL